MTVAIPLMRRAAVIGVITLLAACTVSPPETTTTTTQPAPTTTFISENGRTVEAVGCPNAPESVAFVCEGYQLIIDRYVDDLDPAEMAEAMSEFFDLVDPGNSNGPLTCVIPTPAFVASCEEAAELMLDTEATAEVFLNALIHENLDPFSGYLNPDALARVLEAESPNFAGIGAQVRAEDETIEGDDKQCSVISATCRIFIVATLEDHPARAAGVQADDVVVRVNGQDILGWTVDEVVAAVRGPVGESVTILFERNAQPIEITIVRDLIRVPVIETEVVGDTGYIRLFDFSQPASDQFEQGVIDLLAADVKRIVFDLRYNPGGLLDVAIDVTSVFLPDGDVVVTQSPERTTPYRVTGRSIVPEDMEVHILLNRASASASEVVSAVLQERGRATVYGENSFGKNTVQQRWNLSNGGALRLTTARWLTPGGHNFGGTGLTPDIPLDLGQDATPAEIVAMVLGVAAGS